MELKTLKDLEDYMINQHTQPNCSNAELAKGWVSATKEMEYFLKQEAIKWIKEFDKFTKEYCENEGELTDDEVMINMKKAHPEWEKKFDIDFNDDDLNRFYFLEDWLKYFFNIKEEDLKDE